MWNRVSSHEPTEIRQQRVNVKRKRAKWGKHHPCPWHRHILILHLQCRQQHLRWKAKSENVFLRYHTLCRNKVVDRMPPAKEILHPTCRVAQRILRMTKQANIQPAAREYSLPEEARMCRINTRFSCMNCCRMNIRDETDFHVKIVRNAVVRQSGRYLRKIFRMRLSRSKSIKTSMWYNLKYTTK